MHSLHVLLRRLCSHICDPPHSLHWLLMRLWGQMLDPRHSLHLRLTRSCSQICDPALPFSCAGVFFELGPPGSDPGLSLLRGSWQMQHLSQHVATFSRIVHTSPIKSFQRRPDEEEEEDEEFITSGN